jgi:TRAP-type transport system periplasmic protein
MSLSKTISIILGIFVSIGVHAEEPTYKMRWVLAHEPARVFQRAAQHFADSLAKKSGGKVQLTIVDAKQLKKDTVISPAMAYEMVKSGEIEMSQTYTTSLGQYNKDMWIVDLPFLFRDHNHAAKVLDGPLGGQIVAGLEKTGVKGLGFTYSGGYRIIPSKDKPIASIADFKGMKIRVTKDSPVAAAYLQELGAVPMQVDSENYKSGLDAFETTYARLENVKDDHSKYINETEHSLFLTTILINKQYFEKLPADIQKMVTEAAHDAAKMEREDSIQDGLLSKEKYKKEGFQIVQISSEEKAKMKEKAKKVYQKYDKFFDSHLIADIQSTK